MILENPNLIAFKSTLTNDLKESVKRGRQELKKMEVCAHESNDLNIIFEKVINRNEANADKTFEYVRKKTKKILKKYV